MPRVSPPSPPHPAVRALADLLRLDPLANHAFAGHSHQGTALYGGQQRRYGGELLAQALIAAESTVTAAQTISRPVHSMHAYFLRPAKPDEPVVYRVETLRDGRSFSARSITAWQGTVPVFTCDVSFHASESGVAHAAAMPDVPAPEALPTEHARFAVAREREPERFRGFGGSAWIDRGPFEQRIVEDLWQTATQPPVMHCWVRLRSPAPAGLSSAAIAAYYSDDPIMDNALLPHVGRFSQQQVTTASLDHAMWFHGPIDLTEWHLFAQDSPVAHGARGLTRGMLFRRDGALIASVAQEVLMRPRPLVG